MTEDVSKVPLLNEQKREESGLQGFEIRQRPYRNNAQKGTILKHAWEQAPCGAVFYLKRKQKPSQESVSIVSLRRSLSINSQGNPENDENNQNSLYIPGIKQNMLGQLRATSIAGNDITSSCLYATGIVATAGGRFAPISSAIVCFILYLFRLIYEEVFSALPMNGGTYNAMLNTVDKNWASAVAILSTLSYTSTAVTSAASAGDYLNYQWEIIPSKWICIGIICFFAFLTLMGMKESANAATVIFIFHIITLLTLVISALIYVIKDKGNILRESWESSSTAANPYSTWANNIFFGYSSALLGVTGFESSSNYIEEQKEGVYPKTLRNMWFILTIINPALAILTMGVIPIEKLVESSNFTLALLAQISVGNWMKIIVVIDAALVLSGAVLTAYVGIQGLHRRLALDRIMPEFFLYINNCRGSNHFIIISFCFLTCSLRLLVNDMSSLGGVYAISFLNVMLLLCLASLFLKYKRGKLPRKPIVNPIIIIIAFILILLGLIGNIIQAPRNAIYFIIYCTVFSSVVVATRLRVSICRILHVIIPEKFYSLKNCMKIIISSLRSTPIVYFVKDAELSVLNKSIQYIIDNEETHTVKFIHMIRTEDRFTASTAPIRYGDSLDNLQSEKEFKEGEKYEKTDSLTSYIEDVNAHMKMQQLESCCAIIDQLYPKLTIELLFILASFTPSNVYEVSLELGVPRNFMFMGCPGDRFPHHLGHFGGVRVITY